jgi:hypothetical protein
MNILIVESHNDQYFVQALANNISGNNDVWHIDEFKHSNLEEQKLKTVLADALTTREVTKIGIMLDIDNSNKSSRIDLINCCLEKSIADCDFIKLDTKIGDTGKLVNIKLSDEKEIQIACYFTNIDKKGELEDVLKKIASQKADFADCLFEGWKECFEQKGKKVVKIGEAGGDITDKQLVKLWVDFYKRLDTLPKKKRNEDTTDWKNICLGYKDSKNELIAPRIGDIFNLNHPVLEEMKEFLRLFA